MSDYKVPDPSKKSDWVSCLVLSFKTMKGVEFDDRSWDRIHWSRCSKAAKELLGICDDLREADYCLSEIAKWLDRQELTWTFETIIKHAHEWKRKRGKGSNGDACRKRFFDAIAKQRTETKGQEVRNGPTKADGGALLASIRDHGIPKNS